MLRVTELFKTHTHTRAVTQTHTLSSYKLCFFHLVVVFFVLFWVVQVFARATPPCKLSIGRSKNHGRAGGRAHTHTHNGRNNNPFITCPIS